MQIIAVCNQKGGVGKTTTTLSLAACAAAAGDAVLLVDLDPHASLTLSLGLETADARGGAYALLAQSLSLSELARPTAVAGMDIIASGPALATLERDQGRNPGMGRRLQTICRAQAGAYRWVFVDTPPTLGVLMINALAAADHVVIPTQPDPLSRHGVTGMVKTLDMVNRSRPIPLGHSIVTTFYDRRTRSSLDGLEALNADHGGALWPDVIPVDTQFREASSRGLPLSRCRGASRGAAAYEQLWSYLLQRLPQPAASPAEVA